MKAYVLHGINDLRLEEAEKPQLKQGEVLVEVRAAGICGSDIPRIYQTGAYSYPLIPGHEFAGVVAEGEHKHWLGKRVGIFPLIPCMNCAPCKHEKYELCRNYSYLGSRTNGGFAEYVAVPAANLIELPKHVSFEEAAMLEPMAVAVHAMRMAGAERKDSIAVCGLGTIGLLLTMFLKEAGYEQIYVVGNKDFQKKMALKLGISESHFCDSRKNGWKQWMLEQTQGLGVNTFFECVGKNETAAAAISCTAPQGVVQMVGNPASDMVFEKSIYWKILRNQLTVKGSWNSSFTRTADDDWHYILERFKQKTISPDRYITHRVAFDELESGLHMMRDKTAEYIKVMMVRE